MYKYFLKDNTSKSFICGNDFYKWLPLWNGGNSWNGSRSTLLLGVSASFAQSLSKIFQVVTGRQANSINVIQYILLYLY